MTNLAKSKQCLQLVNKQQCKKKGLNKLNREAEDQENTYFQANQPDKNYKL